MIKQFATALLLTLSTQIFPAHLSPEYLKDHAQHRLTEFLTCYNKGSRRDRDITIDNIFENALKYELSLPDHTLKTIYFSWLATYRAPACKQAFDLMLQSHKAPVNPANEQDNALALMIDNANFGGYWAFEGPFVADLLTAGAAPLPTYLDQLMRQYPTINSWVSQEMIKQSFILLVEASHTPPKVPTTEPFKSLTLKGLELRQERQNKLQNQLAAIKTALHSLAGINVLAPIINAYVSIPFVHQFHDEKPKSNICVIS